MRAISLSDFKVATVKSGQFSPHLPNPIQPDKVFIVRFVDHKPG